MLDHYTLPELAFRLNTHKKLLYKLAALGPGFEIRRIYPTTAPRYVVSKADVYSWMSCIRRDPALASAARRISPGIQYQTLARERDKWIEQRTRSGRYKRVR